MSEMKSYSPLRWLGALLWAVATLFSAHAQAVTITAVADFGPSVDVYSAFGTGSQTGTSGTVNAGYSEQDGGLFANVRGNTEGAFEAYTSARSWVGVAYAPDSNNFSATASFRWEDTITNSGAASQAYVYNLNLAPGYLGTNEEGAVTEPSTSIYARYLLDVLVNGVSVWSSSVEVGRSPAGTTQSQSGASIGGAFGTFTPFDGAAALEGYRWDAFSTAVPLGSFAPGESFTVTYNAILESGGFNSVDSGPLNNYVSVATFRDPAGLGSIPASQVSPVPLPAAIWLFGAGMLSLAGVARHRA
ncbi:MAG TPA: hypothetical protein ENJ79_00575 [Gammaproteobacteria bacterium]|nr:hypothetical protein [Gammaproteobacteria bacterium]